MSLRVQIIILFFMVAGINLLTSQSVNTEFGKNRVQYHDDFDNWWMYETENFITYWYGKGRNVAQSVIQIAEYDHKEIQDIMEHRINDKIQIVVFLDISDLKQSNIGNDETFEGINKQTKVIGSKMFVYFDGNHQNLRKQIRRGIAGVYLNSMFSGSSLQEIVQSSVNLSVPEWFGKGLVSYLTSYWDHLIDDELRDLWEREGKRYQDFDDLSNDFPKIAGHSFWYFLDQNYGKSTISNLLYLTRINRKLDNSFLFVLGTTFEGIIGEWKVYFQNHFETEKNQFDVLPDRNKIQLANEDYAPISQFALNPDGTQLIYVSNNRGKFKVYLRNLETDEERVIFKYGFKNVLQETDYNYPFIAWHPERNEISLVYEHRDLLYLRKIDLETEDFAEQVLPEDFQRVYSLSYYSDLDYIFSATTDGYSDLYLYRSQNRQSVRLTEDFWDDLDASYVNYEGQKGILFSSNRPSSVIIRERLDTILPISNFDVFFYPFDDTPQEAIRITNTINENERYPYLTSGGVIAFLNSKYGITNRHVGHIQAPLTQYPNSNKPRNIIRHHASTGSEMYVYTYYEDGAYVSYVEVPEWRNPQIPFRTNYASKFAPESQNSAAAPQFGVLQLEPKPDTVKFGYLFQSRFDDPPNIDPIDRQKFDIENFFHPLLNVVTPEEQEREIIEFVNARAVAARTIFKLENFTTRLDNDVLFEGLESFTGQDREYLTPPVGILIKAKSKDLFEDYEVEGGIRIPTRFNGTEYFLVFDNNKKLIDKRFAIYRKTESYKLEDFLFPTQKIKRHSLLGMFRAKYPFDVYRSVRATATLRFDKSFHLTSDEYSSSQPVFNEKRISLKGEYVFDNTVDLDINLRHGTRYKVYVEAINSFNLEFTPEFNFDGSNGITTVIGFDARHYIPLLKHSVLALRGAGATSLGNEKILYYLGGVEGSVIPKFNEDIPIPPNADFSYATVAANLRGFDPNIRNGTTFILGNAEFRIPIFKYLKRRKIQSSLLRSVQLIAFYDIGTAWHGVSPNSEDNPINLATIDQPPVLSIKVRYFRDPLVMAYGAGLRINLLGYFLRFDYAWGIESRSAQDPKLSFAIGKDF